jgi:hypothetical protein
MPENSEADGVSIKEYVALHILTALIHPSYTATDMLATQMRAVVAHSIQWADEFLRQMHNDVEDTKA